MTDLETLARDLREAMHHHDGFHAEEIKKWREEPILAWWLAVARHVQQLQRAAWIAGRDAAAEWHKAKIAMLEQHDCQSEQERVDIHLRISDHHHAIKKIRALEPPAQETGI